METIFWFSLCIELSNIHAQCHWCWNFSFWSILGTSGHFDFSANLFCHPFGGRNSLENQEYSKKPPTSHDLRWPTKAWLVAQCQSYCQWCTDNPWILLSPGTFFLFFFLSFMGGETQLNQIRSKKLSQTVARLLKSVGESLRLSTIPRDRIQNGKIPMYKGWADFLCQN